MENDYFLPLEHRGKPNDVVVGELKKVEYEEDKDVEEIKNAIKKLKSIVEEKEKVKRVGERYVEYSKQLIGLGDKLKQITNEIISLANEIDPVRKVLKKTPSSYRTTGIDYKTIIEDLHNKIVHGTEVTLKLIEATYPEVGNGKYHIMKTLKECVGVASRKDGSKFVLFRGG